MNHAVLLTTVDQLPAEVRVVKPYIHTVAVPTIAIADVRSLHGVVFSRPLGEPHALSVVLIAESIRVEAQNALLKLLEDPPPDVMFYVVMSDHTTLLPTLLSRFTTTERAATAAPTDIALQFLQNTYADRLSEIAERTSAKDTVWAAALLAGCERVCRQERWSLHAAQALLFVSQRLKHPGSSPKMLLEYLALTAPQLK